MYQGAGAMKLYYFRNFRNNREQGNEQGSISAYTEEILRLRVLLLSLS